MKWPFSWWRHIGRHRASAKDAKRRLDEAARQRPEVERLGHELRARREANRFRELFEQTIRDGR